jgi:hypothetical protein
MLVNIETLSSDNEGNRENTNPSLLIETKNPVIYNSTLRNMNRFVINFMRLLYKDGYITKESKEKLYFEFEQYLGHHPNQQYYRDFQKIALSVDHDLDNVEVYNRYLAYKFLVASFLKDEVLNEIEKHLNIDKSSYDCVKILMADCDNNDIRRNLYESFPTCRFYGFLANEKGEVEILPSIVPDDFEMTNMQKVLSLTDLRSILVDRTLYITAGRIFIMNDDGKTLAKIC